MNDQIFVIHDNCLDPDRCVSTDCEQVGPPPCQPGCPGDDHLDMVTYRGEVERIERACYVGNDCYVGFSG